MFNYFSRDFLALYFQAATMLDSFLLILSSKRRYKELRLITGICVLDGADHRNPDAFNDIHPGEYSITLDNWVSVVELYVHYLQANKREKWEVKYMKELLNIIKTMQNLAQELAYPPRLD